jgi:plastocyanin
MKRGWASWIAVLSVGLAVALAGASGRAQDKGDKSDRSDRNRAATAGDIARLEAEIREQRTVILHMLKVEQERSDMIIKLLEGRCGSGPALDAFRSTAGDGVTKGAASAGASSSSSSPSSPEGAGDSGGGAAAVATVKGRVQIGGAGGGDIGSIHVYLEGMRSSGKGKTLEIVQKGKQFQPQFAVAIAGTKVAFPNRDIMFHNVFSPAPKPFDLGTRQAGESGPLVELDTPGVVDVYCNIHSKMSAKILVLPNRVFTRVGADGSFRLDKVPVGRRKLVAWGPGFKPQRREVDVTAAGIDVSFLLDPDPEKAHPNKLGAPYGSYKE